MDKTSVKPLGWLREFLQTQKNGLTGHIEKAGEPFDGTYWGYDEHPESYPIFWWPFEQTAYYIDGLTRTAILLEDRELLEKAENIIYLVLNNPDEDGYLGPKELKSSEDSCSRWSHVIFFRACLALYDYNHDEFILSVLTRHYLGSPCDYSLIRNIYNVEILLELYRYTGNTKLLQIAEDAYSRGRIDNPISTAIKNLSIQKSIHGVTYNEYSKLGALLSKYTGNKQYLSDSLRAYKKLKKKYLLPGGCNSSSELTENNFYSELYELCNISDLTWSLHYLAEITDKTVYSDMIEACIFNAGIGAVTEDFRAHQYFSSANQLILSETSSHCKVDIGGKSMAYAPKPFTACCTGNVNRFMPNFIMNLWSEKDDTVTARMYGPSVFKGEISGKPFSIEEKTAYPFELSCCFEIKTSASFKLRLRIPEWCTDFKLKGSDYTVENSFAIVNITKDSLLSLTMDADILKKENHGGVYFTRGPLVYSLGMKGIREKHGDPDFPNYRMMPDKKWNYAVLDSVPPTYTAGTETIWNVENDLPSVSVTAKEVKNWKFRVKTKIKGVDWDYNPIERSGGKWTFTPNFPKKKTLKLDEDTIQLKLVPYGAAKVRITVMPKA